MWLVLQILSVFLFAVSLAFLIFVLCMMARASGCPPRPRPYSDTPTQKETQKDET